MELLEISSDRIRSPRFSTENHTTDTALNPGRLKPMSGIHFSPSSFRVFSDYGGASFFECYDGRRQCRCALCRLSILSLSVRATDCWLSYLKVCLRQPPLSA